MATSPAGSSTEMGWGLGEAEKVGGAKEDFRLWRQEVNQSQHDYSIWKSNCVKHSHNLPSTHLRDPRKMLEA
jgi:hypothetical protein